MLNRLRVLTERAYRRHLHREIEDVPTHVAIIQDGNRRYARERGDNAPDGHRAGAATTERVLDWCADLGVAELTLYAFSTENFERPDEELEPLFDLLETKLRDFADADRVHEQGVRVRAIGDVDRLPERVRDAVDYAERRTADNDRFTLNVALAYGGRTELLDAATAIARDVDAGDLDPTDVDVETVEERLYDRPVRDVDPIVRTGGDERTSNFLPWHANGNEAAVSTSVRRTGRSSRRWSFSVPSARTSRARSRGGRPGRSGRSRSFGRSPRWKSPRRTRWRATPRPAPARRRRARCRTPGRRRGRGRG